MALTHVSLVVRTAPEQAVFSPKELGGVGLHRTEVNQTIDHVNMILQHGHQQTVTGQHLAIESGLGGDPIQLDLGNVEYLTENTWIERVVRSCKKFNIRIESGVKGIPKWTTRDAHIMEKAVQNLGQKELRTVNKVRIYLRVATISDIAIASGTRVDSEIMEGRRGTSPSPSSNAYDWPNVPEPTTKERSVWRNALCRLLHITAENPSLHDTNYRWFEKEAIKLTGWNLDVNNDIVFQRNEDGWIRWDPMTLEERRTTRRSGIFTKTQQQYAFSEDLSFSDWRPITIKYCEGDNRLCVVAKGRYHPPST